MTINNWYKCHVIVDGGANISLMSEQTATAAKLQIDTSSRISISSVNGSSDCIGRCTFSLQIGPIIKQVTIYILKEFKHTMLIGTDLGGVFRMTTDLETCEAFLKTDPHTALNVTSFQHETHGPNIGPQPHPHQATGSSPTSSGSGILGPQPISVALEHLLKQHQTLFSKSNADLGLITAANHRIRTTHENPIYTRPFRNSIKDNDSIRINVKTLIAQARLRPSTSPYNSPVFNVKKKDGTPRMVLDYSKLNSATIDDRQPLPLIQEVLDRLQGKRIFSVLDIAWGFWQVPMDPTDIPKTAFSTSDGHFEWTCMPMGLKGAPATFQRIIQTILADLLYSCVINYLDDLIIYSDNEEDHFKHLNMVFEKLKSSGIKLKKEKCTFLRTSVEYLGMVISLDTIRPSPSKIKAIQSFPEPQSKRHVQRFLGLVNYLRKQIPQFTEKATSLQALTGNQEFEWKDHHQKCFEALKRAITSESCLFMYDPLLETELHTDASAVRVGAVLIQVKKDQNGGPQHRPIAYFSQKLSAPQQKWNTTELEAYAVFLSVQHFQVYLSNGPFTVITDHSALTWAQNNKKLKAKLHRWFVKLSEFTFKIIHRKGKLNQHADALSRAPLDSNMDLDPGPGEGLEPLETFLVSPNPITEDLLRNSQSTLNINDYRNPINVDGIWKINIKGSLRSILPEALKMDLLEYYHDDHGHPGTPATLRLIKEWFWWPNYSQDVIEYVRSCQTCQQIKSRNHPTHGPQLPLEPPDGPFERLGIDTIILGRSARASRAKVIINFVDHFTRFVWAFPCANNSTETLIQCMNSIIKSFGRRPKLVVTDQGKNFVSSKFHRFLTDNKIGWRVSTSYHPQTNGLVEKMNHTLIVRLRVKLLENPKIKWSSHLPDVVNEMNSTPHQITGFPPEYLMYAWPPNKTPIEEARKLAKDRTIAFQKKKKALFQKKKEV